MSDIYKTAFALTMEGRLEQQILEAARSFRALDKSITSTQAALNKLHLPRGIFGELSKLKGEFGGVVAAAAQGNKSILASYAAMGGKLRAEMQGLKGVAAEVASVMNREMKGAFNGVSSEVSALNRQVSELRNSMRGLGTGGGRVRPGHGGGGGAGGGGGLLDTIAMGPSHSGYYAGVNVERFGLGFVQDNASLQRQANIYRMTGRSEADVTAGMSAAYRSATMVPDVGVVEQMKLLRELDSATQDAVGSRAILPMIARAKSTIAAATGRDSEEDMRRLFKFIELRGGAIDEHTHKIMPEKFGKELNAATKALVAGGGLLTLNDLQMFGRQAGIMAKNMSPDDLYVSALAAMEDMGGARAGTGLTAVGRQFIGGTMKSDVVKALNEYGLLNKAGVETTEQGEMKVTDPSQAIKGYETLTRGSFMDYIEKVVRPALVAKGVTSREDQNKETFRLFGTDTARRIASLYLSSPEQMEAVGKRYHMSMGTDAYDKVLGDGKDFNTSSKALSESIHTLKTALGDSETLSGPLFALAKGISAVAEQVRGQGGTSTLATLGVTGTGAAGLAFGAYKTVTGFGLPAAATQLSAAAVALEAAAAKLGGSSLAGDAAKAAPAAGALSALGLTGIIAGTVAAGSFAGYATAKTLPGIARKEGPGAVDPATGEHIGSGVPQTTPWLRDWMKSWFESPAAKGQAEEAGKKAGEATSKGFTGTDFAGAGSTAGSKLLQGLQGALSKIGSLSVAPISLKGGTAHAAAAVVPVRATAPTAGAPPKQKEETHIHNVYMDGEKVERHVTRRLVAKAKYPTSIGGTDTYGVWHGPGTAGTKVA